MPYAHRYPLQLGQHMLLEQLQARLEAQAAQALLRQRRIVSTPCQPHVSLYAGGATDPSPPVPRLAFCSNDYLGLAAHPELATAWAEGARLHGAGSGASALISGHSHIHAALEERLAATQAAHIPHVRALLFSSGFMANLAVITALADAQTAFFSEALNHASLIDALRLARSSARAHIHVYPHADIAALQQQLTTCTAPIKVIVTDALFSMDGHLAPLQELLQLAMRHRAWLLLDDAHGFGVMGAHGHGVLQALGLQSERLIYVGTLSKAAGQQGAFVAAHDTIIRWLIQAARSYIYTTALPPAQAYALLRGLDLITGPEGQARRATLQARITQWQQLAHALLAEYPHTGWQLAPSHSPIQPLIVGDSSAALHLSAQLEHAGLWVPAIRPPTVPKGQARLRIALSAAHSTTDIQQLVSTLADIARQTQPSPQSLSHIDDVEPNPPRMADAVVAATSGIPAMAAQHPHPLATDPANSARYQLPEMVLPHTLRGLFVTGTDTEVGKTHVAAALLRLAARHPELSHMAGCKPVAAGTDASGHNEDVCTLLSASSASLQLSTADICPFLLPEPCAPHIAARLAKRPIVMADVLTHIHTLSCRANALIVEGIGGFCVPFGDSTDPWHSSSALASALNLPVVLVVGLRLGCINHALLTAEAIARRGLRIAGWIGTHIDPHMTYAPDNIHTLTQQLQQHWHAPCWGIVPHLPVTNSGKLPNFDPYIDEHLISHAILNRYPLP